MGGDGGSIPRRDDLVRSKQRPPQADRSASNAARWRHCSLTQDRLRQPIVSCRLGRLYNKESIINKLLNRNVPNNVADHVKKLKDVRELRLTINPSHTKSSDPLSSVGEFFCPITGLEMTGTHPFIYLWPCGCVFAKKAVEMVHENRCMQCGKPFTADDTILINPQTEEELAIAEKRLKSCSAEKMKKRPLPEEPSKPLATNQLSDENSSEEPKKKERRSDEEKKQPNQSIQQDPNATSVYKSLFVTSEEAKRQPKSHWVTYNPLYFR